jgi:hypothetical protein
MRFTVGLLCFLCTSVYAECYRATNLTAQNQGVLKRLFGSGGERRKINYVIHIDENEVAVTPQELDCIREPDNNDGSALILLCGRDLRVQIDDNTVRHNDQVDQSSLTELYKVRGELIETWTLFTDTGVVFVSARDKDGVFIQYAGVLAGC